MNGPKTSEYLSDETLWVQRTMNRHSEIIEWKTVSSLKRTDSRIAELGSYP
jgi:hypothetical protein